MRNEKDSHLTLSERQILYPMLASGEGFSKIAKVLNRDRSTLRREYKRNSVSVYLWSRLTPLEQAKHAHDKALLRRSDSKRGKKGPLKLAAIRLRIESLLEDCKYTPEEIAIILGQGDDPVKVSGKTIRRWILKEAKELQQHLAFRGKKRRNQLSPRKNQRRKEAAPAKRNIDERPCGANERQEAGHKEYDFITCKQSTVSILVGIDRKVRRCWLRLVNNREAETTRAMLMQIESSLCPPLRKTSTFDNEGGFQKVFQLEQQLGIESFFCDPYCSWQKGAVEHLNRRVRRYFPKGTDLSTIKPERLSNVEAILNARPMECLDKLSPDQCWAIEVEKAKMMLH